MCLDPLGKERGFNHNEAEPRPQKTCHRDGPPHPHPPDLTNTTWLPWAGGAEGYRKGPGGGRRPQEGPRREAKATKAPLGGTGIPPGGHRGCPKDYRRVAKHLQPRSKGTQGHRRVLRVPLGPEPPHGGRRREKVEWTKRTKLGEPRPKRSTMSRRLCIE